ncbi:MFS transporter [Streptomyces atratus]|nr:MFS transporter [Streptomyces atratus]
MLALVLAAQFMALLDIFIVNVTAPTIRSEPGASGAGLQLIVAGYTITYAVLLITGARLGGLLGHGRAHLAGFAVFTAASSACGLAAGTGQLIAFRLIQGAGAAAVIPQVLSLIQRHFAGEARIRALGAYSAVLATGAAAGQVVGGVLVGADLFGAGRRPVFLANVPIGPVLLVPGIRALPGEPRTGESRAQACARGLDLPGPTLLAATVTLLTVPPVLGQELDRPVWAWVCLIASAGFFTGFVGHESRLAARGGAPLIGHKVLRIPGMARAVLRIPGMARAVLRIPGMARAVLRILVVMAINAGFLFATTLHVHGGLGYSALRTGLMSAPTALVFGAIGLTWRRWPTRLQGTLVPGGFALMAVASVAVGLLMRDGGDGGPRLYAAFAITGSGMALGFSPPLRGRWRTCVRRMRLMQAVYW